MRRALSPEETLDLLTRSSALLSGHFRLSSGLHSDRYIQCARALESPSVAERLGAGIAALVPGPSVEAVAAPALGGILIGHEVARALGVRFLFAERDGATLAFRRGFALRPGERLLLVEDVLTTGGSISELRDLCAASGALVTAMAAIVDRTAGAFSPGVPVHALAALDVPRYRPEECPLCARGVPVVKPGSRPA